MPCFHPRKGYRSKTVNPSGKRSIVFNINEGYKDLPVTVPCGGCIGCRLGRSIQWAIRIHHEASLHETNSFLTLTYDDEHLPENAGLNVKDYQDFMKRLRERLAPLKVRYYHCGEYGENFSRPHYHSCLFGYDFPDKELWTTKNGNKLYVSQLLNDTWGLGHATIGDVTLESAAYVARYITKKITGDLAEMYYTEFDPETGEELRKLRPEYATMSKGIGKGWFEKYHSDVFPNDYVVVEGKKFPFPKYYATQLEKFHKQDYLRLRGRSLALKERSKNNPNNTPQRLLVREEVQTLRFFQYKREYDYEG